VTTFVPVQAVMNKRFCTSSLTESATNSSPPSTLCPPPQCVRKIRRSRLR
jgi:hypothetical protein